MTTRNELEQMQAELIMAKQFLHEVGTDPEAWIDGVLMRLDALLAASSEPEPWVDSFGNRTDMLASVNSALRDAGLPHRIDCVKGQAVVVPVPTLHSTPMVCTPEEIWSQAPAPAVVPAGETPQGETHGTEDHRHVDSGVGVGPAVRREQEPLPPEALETLLKSWDNEANHPELFDPALVFLIGSNLAVALRSLLAERTTTEADRPSYAEGVELLNAYAADVRADTLHAVEQEARKRAIDAREGHLYAADYALTSLADFCRQQRE